MVWACPCQSSPSLTIIVPLLFISISYGHTTEIEPALRFLSNFAY